MSATAPALVAGAGEGSGLLLVEDNLPDARLFELMLEDGWPDAPPVHVCTRIAEARARMLQHRPLCVLVDLTLPDAARLEAVHVIREADPTVPIVVLSGVDDAALAIEAMGAGAQDYLLKGRLDGGLVARSIRYAVERKRAENALRESNELAARAFDDAAVGMALITLDGTFLRVNGALLRLVGRAESDLLATTPEALSAPDEAGGVILLDRLLHGGHDAYELERRFRHADGHGVSVQIDVALMRDALGRPLHIIAQFNDVTARRRAESYRVAQHAATRALAEAPSLEAAHVDVLSALCRTLAWDVGVLWNVDPRDGSLRCDAAYALGAAEADLMATTPSEIVDRDGLPARAKASSGPVWTDRAPLGRGTRGRLPDGAGLRCSLAVPLIAGTEVLGVLEFLGHDIPAPDVDLLDVLAALSLQIGNVFSRRRAEAEAERLKDEFIGLVSHELRTPLTSIVGYLELLTEEDGHRLSEPGRDFLEVIERNTDRLQRLVGDLLFVVQVEARPLAVTPAPVRLADVVRESVESARPLADEKGVRLRTAVGEATCDGDHGRLAQVLDNLLGNALKFTGSGGSIDVDLVVHGDRARIEVRDTGVGIPEADQAHLFERFFRASNAAEQETPGAGLGLTIVKAIVEAHGGSVGVESSERVGTTFSVDLPRAIDRTAAAAAA